MADITPRRPRLPTSKKPLDSSGGTNMSLPPRVSLDDVLEKYETKNTSRIIGLSDATGSMSGLWSKTQKHLTEMIARIARLGECELRWVAYRDYGDGNGLLESSGWEKAPEPLLRFIQSIHCHGGQDWEEAVEKALEFAANDDRATRVLLIGDAPPHAERDYRQQAKRLGQLERPVFSFVVGGSPETFRVFSEISQLSGGTCCHLEDVDDLIDVVVITAAHDMGGEDLVLEYTRKYAKQLSSSGKSYSSKLLMLKGG
uniref:von Willebrand factor type A domain-containing protein n=1 Tax=Candidatus Kentrum eta TaxID=2126337 RepID=A0A450U8M7_9GAMM|nr:MAG: von Willebrand factor type A domain-containing protein [Candidatus Kentron sp. H]VFJ88203.1 MAG: von Willebrand factor type A domain-containing protein [Candidatus Kentron sp. H]VFJ95430.1 MAG: von Willebrand factor type A domain-containing protein [Candidatus Kentron sp. H]